MKQITEDYVSFEVAKLLKEKEFDMEDGAYYYPYYFTDRMYSQTGFREAKYNLALVAAPTQALVIKWLRVEHNIDIEITTYHFHGVYVGKRYKHLIYRTPNTEEGESEVLQEENSSDTYEESTEQAILYILQNLIK